MRRILSAILGILLGIQVVAQSDIVALEYFIDEDPGVGNGTSIPITQGPTLDITYTIPTSGMGLSNGLHVIGVRSQNSNGIWSMIELRTFYIQPDVGVSDPPTEDITAVEYFIGEDPGQGNGINLSVTQGQTLDFTDLLSTNSLPNGYHVVGVRAQNAKNIWGMAEIRIFYVQNLSAPGSQTPADIVELEYFFNEDPGQGAGTSISVAQGQVVDISETLTSSGLAKGYHSVHIRAKNSNGIWGLAEKRTFYIQSIGSSTSDAILIDKLEYYLDEDPGFGNGINIPITSGVPTVDLISEVLSTQGPLSIGEHKIVIRGQGANGAWGFPEMRTFDVDGDCPIADFSVALACEDEALEITDLSSGILGDATYQWYADGEPISTTEGDITHTFANPGSHTLSLSIVNGAVCTDSSGVELNVKQKPFVVFSVQDVTVGDTSRFEVDTFGVDQSYFWSWDFESDASIDDSTVGNTYFVFPDSGAFTSTLYLTDSLGCETSVAREVNVLPLDTMSTVQPDPEPEPDPVPSTPDTIIIESPVKPIPFFSAADVCLGTTMIFSDLSQNADSATYAWDFDGDSIIDESNAGDVTFLYTSPGIYMARLTVTTDTDTASYTQEVAVSAVPSSDFQVVVDCDGTAVFTNLSGNVSNGSYSWDFDGDGIIDSDSDSLVSFEYPDNGNFTASLLVKNNSSCFDLSVRNIEVEESTTAAFDWDYSIEGERASVVFTNQTVNANTFNWDFGDGNSSTDRNPLHSFANPGSQPFTVCLLVENACSQDTVCQELVFAVSGIEDDWIKLQVFPNPSNGTIQVDLSNIPPGNIQLEIVDLTGRVIRQVDYFKQKPNPLAFTISQLPKGVFQLQVTAEEFTSSKLFVVQADR